MGRLTTIALLVGLLAGGGAEAVVPGTCVGLRSPVTGSVLAGFAPVGRFGGHWGLDIAAPPGTPVVAPADGNVSFAGSVVDNQAISIDHGGGLVSTVSYLDEILVSRGQRVAAGSVIGRSGLAHGAEAVHLSVRVGGAYVDPEPLLGCLPAVPGAALRLVDEAR